MFVVGVFTDEVDRGVFQGVVAGRADLGLVHRVVLSQVGHHLSQLPRVLGVLLNDVVVLLDALVLPLEHGLDPLAEKSKKKKRIKPMKTLELSFYKNKSGICTANDCKTVLENIRTRKLDPNQRRKITTFSLLDFFLAEKSTK